MFTFRCANAYDVTYSFSDHLTPWYFLSLNYKKKDFPRFYDLISLAFHKPPISTGPVLPCLFL